MPNWYSTQSKLKLLSYKSSHNICNPPPSLYSFKKHRRIKTHRSIPVSFNQSQPYLLKPSHVQTMYPFAASFSYLLPPYGHIQHLHGHVLHSAAVICHKLPHPKPIPPKPIQQIALGIYQGRFVCVRFKNNTLKTAFTANLSSHQPSHVCHYGFSAHQRGHFAHVLV